jgi:membrane protease YdiL (CAAX protease family)
MRIEAFRDREVWTALVLIVVVNVVFIWAIHNDVLPDRLYNKGRFLLLGLTLASVVFLFRRWQALADLLRPLSVWRISPGWILLAALWAPSICMLAYGIHSLTKGANERPFVLDFGAIGNPSVALTVLLGAFVGEMVWVSYSIARLARYASVAVASLVVALFWTAWWVPIVKINVGVVPDLPLAPLIINMLGVALMCGFFYAKTNSGIPVLILQTVLNSSLLVFPVAPATGGVPIYWTFSLTYLAAAIAMHVLFGPRPLLAPPQVDGLLPAGEPKRA